MHHSSDLKSGLTPTHSRRENPLAAYIQALSPEEISRLSHPPHQVTQLMEGNILGMLGILPGQEFNIAVTTSRENLAQLLVSAMSYGYFLHSAEQRLVLENNLLGCEQQVET
jgi:hypothetical protein